MQDIFLFLVSPPLISPLIATLISVFVISIVSLVGIFFIHFRRSNIQKLLFVLVSFAVGTLLGDVFFHLFPEIYTETQSPLFTGIYVLGGIFLFFCLEHFLHWHHYHNGILEGHAAHPSAYTNIAADALHNFVDGLIIGASFLMSLPLGIATTLTIIFHEIPQELGDFSILINAGFSKAKALAFNFFSATFAIFGGLIAVLVGPSSESFAPALVAITAGGFLYLALSDLVPQLHKNIRLRHSVIRFFAALFGVAIMFALTFFE